MSITTECAVPEVHMDACGDNAPKVDVATECVVQDVQIDHIIENCKQYSEVPNVRQLDHGCDIRICSDASQSTQDDNSLALQNHFSNGFADCLEANCELLDKDKADDSLLNGIKEHVLDHCTSVPNDNSSAAVVQSSQESLISCVECGYSGK